MCDKLDKLDSDRYKRAPLLEHCTLNVHFACLSTTLIASSLTAWLKKGTSAIAQVEQVEQEIVQVCPMSISAYLVIAATPESYARPDVDSLHIFLDGHIQQTIAQDMPAWKHKLCLDFF